MPERVDALVNPPLLEWARRASGLDVEAVAKKAAVKPSRVESWEKGDSRPTIGQLRALARIYKRPIAVFYLPAPPPEVGPRKDFRRLPGVVAGVESPELRYEFRRAVARREIALELLSEEGEQPAVFAITGQLADRAEDLGAQVREALGVTLDLQSSWRRSNDAFNGWRTAIEKAGALVLQMTDVEISEARGFAIGEFPLPAIVANIKDAPNGRVFTLLHELVHLALRQDGLCDLDDTSSRQPELLRIERFCNMAAGAALVPTTDLLASEVLATHGATKTWSDDELQSLARNFSVSREVILRRLLDIDRTSQAFYLEKRNQFLEAYQEAREATKGGFAPPYQVAFASAGPTFAGLVLSSYAHGTITASDVSDYLGIRLKHLPQIEQQLLSIGRAAAR